jgi:hypothetical protein
MYRLRLFYVARVFLRAFGRRGEGARPPALPEGFDPRRGLRSAASALEESPLGGTGKG